MWGFLTERENREYHTTVFGYKWKYILPVLKYSSAFIVVGKLETILWNRDISLHWTQLFFSQLSTHMQDKITEKINVKAVKSSTKT